MLNLNDYTEYKNNIHCFVSNRTSELTELLRLTKFNCVSDNKLPISQTSQFKTLITSCHLKFSTGSLKGFIKERNSDVK